MNRPSEKALRLGEELFDHVPYGLTQVNAIQELAEMVDESNSELLAAVRAVLHEAQRPGAGPSVVLLAQLQRVCSDYEPIAWSSDAQGELVCFAPPAQGQSPADTHSEWEIPLPQR